LSICFIWLTGLAKHDAGRNDIFKNNVVPLIESTLTVYLPLIDEPNFVDNILQCTADLLQRLLVRFGKFKERKKELYDSNIFNLTIQHYLGSKEPILYLSGLRILNSFLMESPVKFSQAIVAIHEACMDSEQVQLPIDTIKMNLKSTFEIKTRESEQIILETVEFIRNCLAG